MLVIFGITGDLARVYPWLGFRIAVIGDVG